MKILNFGSLNMDYVYEVEHIVIPGETQKSFHMNTFVGGKGLNQSVALRKAGAELYHAGMVGEDGKQLIDMCKKNGINTSFIRMVEGKSGHTIIQIDKNAQNSILLYGGSNDKISEEFINEVLAHFTENDYLILQNEIEKLDMIIHMAFEKKMHIILNPSPYNEKIERCDFSKVSMFIMNEIEGKMMSHGCESAKEILRYMGEKYPKAKIVLTLGSDGAYYKEEKYCYFQKIFPVEAVDTTAAGDTFTGYFLYGYINQLSIEDSMELAACASSIAISRKGAVASIPVMEEVKTYLQKIKQENNNHKESCCKIAE